MSICQLRAVALAAALLPTLAAAAPLTLDQALELAVQRSEATRSARAGVTSAKEAARAAGQLPDPMLTVGVDNLPITGSDRFSTTRESMTMKRVGVSQEWVSSAKRSARQVAADALVARESVATRAAAAEVRLQTALAYLDAYYAGEMLRLATLTEHHTHEESEVATGRLASLSGSSQEVLALTSARGAAEDESAEARQTLSIARVALARWIGVEADELAFPVTPSTADEPTFVAHHPSLLAAQREIEVARQDASVAATNRVPNWTWELSYGQRTGFSDLVSFGVSIPLPVATAQRQDRETASKLALAEKAEAGFAEATRAATAEYRSLTGNAQRLSERIQRYRTSVVLPAQQRTAAATAGYRSNQLDLKALFEARHAEVEAQRRLLMLERELDQTRAQLAFRPLAAGGAQ